MSEIVRNAGHRAAQSLAQQGLRVKRSHLGEVMAALLGYGTYAALTTEDSDAQVTHHLDDAEILVLDEGRAADRCCALSWQLSSSQHRCVVDACIEALTECAGDASVFTGLEDLYDSWAKERIAEAIFHSAEICQTPIPLAWPTMNSSPSVEVSLWESRIDWVIEGFGAMRPLLEDEDVGDPSDDSSSVSVRGRLVFRKAGRSGLIAADCGGAYCAPDDGQSQPPSSSSERPTVFSRRLH